MAFDRSKYKSAPLQRINEGIKDAEKNSSSFKGNGGGGSQTKYHILEEGDNWFKIAPAHDPNDPPYVPFSSSRLDCEVNKWVNGEMTDEKEVKMKSIFIATVHSPKDDKGRLIVSKDPIETYISYVNKKLNEEYPDKEERKKKESPLRGFRGRDGKWVFGILPDHKIAVWAWNEQGEIGRLDLSRKQYREMEKLSLRENADEVIPSDIFVDLDEGYPVILSKNIEQQGKIKKTNYVTSIDQPKKKESWEGFFERVRPTDKQVEEWLEKKPLKELFVESYREQDFNMAVDGLNRFDKKYGFDIFSDDEFLTELEEISKMVDKLPKKDKEITDSKPSKKESKDEKKGAGKEATPIQMKKFLRDYIAENYSDEEELPNLSKDDLVAWYELALADEELPFDDYSDDAEEEADEQEAESDDAEEVEAEDVEEEDVASEIAKLRRRRG